MTDFVQGLDPAKLVLAGAVLSFVLSPFTAPAYNLPIFLFGTLAHESSDAVQSLKLFAGALSASILFDIVWMFNNDQSGLAKFLLLLLWLLKFPTALAFLSALRQRGSQFMGLGADVSGPTVWSMPGGFTSTSREGYQVVDDEPQAQPQPQIHSQSRVNVPRGLPPPPPPASALTPSHKTGHAASTPAPGNYQSA